MSSQYFYGVRNVFVATDFLSYATQALREALAFADRTHSQLTVFHALERMSPGMREILFPYAALGCDEVDILEELRAGATRTGEEYLKGLLGERANEIRLNISFSRDSLPKSILYYASELGADIIYVGAYGTKPHTTGIIGSMASMLVAYARTPLYLVKDPVRLAGHQKILVALTNEKTATSLLAWAISFAMQFENADLEIVSPVADLKLGDATACYENYNLPEKMVASAIQTAEKRAKMAVQLQEIPLVYEPHGKKLSFHHHTPFMSVVSGILSVAEKTEADLIVMQSGQPELTPDNVSRDIVRSVTEYANQNVLIIPRGKLIG